MPKVSQFAGTSLLHQAGGFEPQRKNNFAVDIVGLQDMETLVLAIKEADIPAIDVIKKGIKYFNQTVHYAGSVTPFENQTLKFHDYLDRNVLDALVNWYKQVWDPATGGIGFAARYKKEGSIFLLPPGMPGNTPGVVEATAYRQRLWKLQGVWPTKLKYDPLDHDSDGENTLITLELSVDVAVPASMDS